MKKTQMRMMMSMVGFAAMGSCLLTSCKKKDAPGETELSVTPTLEAQLQVAGEPTPECSDITVKTNSFSYEINDPEDEKIPLIHLDMDDIVVTVKDQEEASQKINDFLQKEKKELAAMADEQSENAKSDYGWLSEDSREYWYGYSISSSYYIERSDKNCLSLLRNTSYDFGGPHPNNECLVYNFNPETGDVLTLDDVAEDMTSFRELVNEKILAACKEIDQEMMSEGDYEEGDTILLPDYEENVPKILQEGTWYFNDKGLIIIANEETISSHAYGSFDIEIPYGELQYVKERFMK